jgi:creatinine amidohydrolase
MFGNLNWKDLDEIKRKEKFILLLPIGSTETHGPHCAISTDAIISMEVSLSAAERLHRMGYEAYVLPNIAYSVTECARNFPGTISISPETETALITEILLQLIKHGMKKICIVNDHGEPGNVRAIYDAMDAVYEKTGVRIIYPNKLRKKNVVRLTEAYQKGESHADRWETSIIMAINPDLVNEERRKKLKYIPINLADKLFKEGLDEFQAMGMPESYCGDPASASAKEGTQTLNTLTDFVVEAVEEFFQGTLDTGRGLFGRKQGSSNSKGQQ